MDTRRARAERAIAIMAEGGTIAEAAEATGLTYVATQLIRAGKTWPDLERPAVWPSAHPQLLTDELAAAIIARVAAGEDRAHVCLTCGVPVTIQAINNVVAGRTFKHLPRPEQPPKVPKPTVIGPGPRPMMGSANCNAVLKEAEVQRIAGLLQQHGTLTTRAYKAIAREYDVHYLTIRAIARGDTWSHVTGIKPP